MSLNRAIDFATALQAYAVKQKPTGRVTSVTKDVNDLLVAIGLRKGSFDRLFPALFSLHGLDVAEALNRAVKDGDISPRAAEVAIAGINNAMVDISKRYPVMTPQVFREIDDIINDFIIAFNTNGADSIDSIKVREMSEHMERLKRKFSSPYIVAYFAGDANRVASLKVAHNSFSNLRDIVNTRIKESISVELTKNRITNSKLTDQNYLTTKIINWGHTRADDSIISGKILAELMSARNAIRSVDRPNEVVKLIVEDFLEQTGQQKNIIKVHHGELTLGDPQVLQMVVSSEVFQKVIVQNRRENQEDLGQLEKQWSLLDAVGRKNLLSAFKLNSVTQLALKLIRAKSSPSVFDNIENLIVSSIKGTKAGKTKKSISLLNNSTPIVKRRKKAKVSSNISTPRLRKDSGIVTTKLDLSSILFYINAKIVEQVKRNMGGGNRQDVLNLRSGRFAESVKVERLSESRAGMITAFYSYMKNPYATFSQGGRQELPRSRDPKLLISKSIRELMQEQMANRMRAVAL